MKKLAMSVMLGVMGAGLLPMDALGQTAFRDKNQNIYIDGVPPNQIFRVTYIPDPTRRDRRYKSAWMYQSTTQFTCTVHHLWSTKRFPLNGSLVVFNTHVGDLTIPLSGAGSPSYTANENPCNGNQINSALPWREVSPGIKVIRSTNSCRFNYTYGFDDDPSIGCVSLPVIYIAGLPNPSYRVGTSTPEVRMVKSNSCGFLKLANTQKWQAYPKDRFTLQTDYRFDHEAYQVIGTFNRGDMAYRETAQIPRCFNGVRFQQQ